MSGQAQSGNGSSSSGEGQTGKRTITIVTTRGQKKKTIEFDGTTWEGLKKEVEKAGYDLSNMKAVEGVRRNSLEHPQALIPEDDFNLFLMPYQSKSGNERSEMYTLIKKYKDKFDDAKDFFGDYTHTPSNKLKSKLKKFERTHDVGEVEETGSDKEMIGKAIDDIANGNPDTLFEEVSKLSLDEKFYLLIKIVSDLKGLIVDSNKGSVVTARTPQEIEQLDKEKKDKEEKDKKDKEEKERLKKEEDERIKKEREQDEKLQNEMTELMSDMPEVERRRR